jgi:hypothetical protein
MTGLSQSADDDTPGAGQDQSNRTLELAIQPFGEAQDLGGFDFKNTPPCIQSLERGHRTETRESGSWIIAVRRSAKSRRWRDGAWTKKSPPKRACA